MAMSTFNEIEEEEEMKNELEENEIAVEDCD
jgi:hypothetical protein